MEQTQNKTTTDMQYHISVNGQPQGPYDEAAVHAMYQAGSIQDTTLVWGQGMADWKTYREVFPVTGTTQTYGAPASAPTPRSAPVPAPAFEPAPSLASPTSHPLPAVHFYNLLESCLSCMKRYVSIQGRACRSEYWWFWLVTFIISNVLGGLPCLILILPLIAAGTRRMHDVGKSGWFQLIPIYSIILMVTPSAPANQYGEGPLPPAK